MEKIRKIISWAAPVLCIITSGLIMLYLFHYFDNVMILFVMSLVSFVVSVSNLLMKKKIKFLIRGEKYGNDDNQSK